VIDCSQFAGISNTSTIYKRGIRVCTGTGLGTALSTCIQNDGWFLVWVCSDPLKTFGPTISSLIHKNIPPERMCLWDSKERGGRPDIVQLVALIYREWNAEVVFITSNWDGNRELMEGCKKLGIPAFVSLSRVCSGVRVRLIFSSFGGHALGFLSSQSPTIDRLVIPRTNACFFLPAPTYGPTKTSPSIFNRHFYSLPFSLYDIFLLQSLARTSSIGFYIGYHSSESGGTNILSRYHLSSVKR